MKSLDDALHLIERAFAQARAKSPGTTQMSLAVLNNRLLALTNRAFQPADYGKKNLRTLFASLEHAVRVFEVNNVLHLELVVAPSKNIAASASAPASRPNGAVQNDGSAAPANERAQPTSGAAEGLPEETSRIRPDLWAAAVDYSSGITYVWDEAAGKARAKSAGDDPGRPMPTLTRDELQVWRSDFLNEHREAFGIVATALIERWRVHGQGRAAMPPTLMGQWNQELTRRVRQRLHAFFSERDAATPGGEHAAISNEQGDRFGEELAVLAARGDMFGIGELWLRSLSDESESRPSVEGALAQVLWAWGSTKGQGTAPEDLAEVISTIDRYSAPNLSLALVSALYRLQRAGIAFPDEVNDLAYKLKEEIAARFGVDRRSPAETLRAAIAQLQAVVSELDGEVARFLRTTPATAKSVSIELVKLARRLYSLLTKAESQMLRDLDVLVGPAFRKFCEAYERNDDAAVLRRGPEFLVDIRGFRRPSGDAHSRSVLWTSLVQPVVDHLGTIVEEATSRGEEALAPSLILRNHVTKADLRTGQLEVFLSFTLCNVGRGHAHDVSLQPQPHEGIVQMSLAEPAGPFDVPPGGERLVRVRLVESQPATALELPLAWVCQTTLGRPASFTTSIVVTQQVTEPNWDALLTSPPYSLNPIRQPDRLYGRDSALRKLHLAAMAGASTFVWGQKRIGKTSLLQVLAAELGKREDTTCVLLRMGELTSLHEGELGMLIARRLIDGAGSDLALPSDAEFGASIGRLIPFVERLVASRPSEKFVVIIDEFDDLDPSFYTGERGKQFVKALRSISEAGLTFFFIGSERMEAIYGRHQADLNKWTNIQLDRIDSRTDCAALIEAPVTDVIEYSSEAIAFIIDYTAGNPFYIHNFCYQVFYRCLQEHRTFVDGNDTHAVRLQLFRTLGQTNFSHFWEDNPVLDSAEKRRATAENCILLAALSLMRGKYEDVSEILEVQESLPLAAEDRASAAELRRACERLLSRKILVATGKDQTFQVSLPIFRDWLAENGVSKLLPAWTEHLHHERSRATEKQPAEASPDVADTAFPIAEDDLLAVAQGLMYCGRQKDVAEIRAWLRQFDDDGRIEMAFALLRRVAERGFFNEGARALGLHKLEEMIAARRRQIGDGVWHVVKNRLDDLCISYVDSDHKSGAVTARDIQKSMRPGKCAATSDLEIWMRTHLEESALVVLVDDFAGTGETLAKGIKRFRDKVAPEIWKRYADEGRLSLYVMFAFPEAIRKAKAVCPQVDVVAANVVGDELRACDEEARIYETPEELQFARDVLLQIGRELNPAAPLGFGDQGALVVFHNTAPNNTLPVFWSNGTVGERPWKPLFPRA